MTASRLKTKITSLAVVLLTVSLSVLEPPLCAATRSGLDSPVVSPETRARLQEIERRRRELHERANQLRRNELAALVRIHKIENKLHETKGVLNEHKEKLSFTVSKISETQQTLSKTESAQEQLTEQAAKRLREIFEGERVSLLEMLFSVDSLQTLLDRAYYQERVAEMDRHLLEQLRQRAALLAQKKDKLGEQRSKLGDLVATFMRKAMEFAKQKSAEEQVAERLRTQRAFYEHAERQLACESQRLETQIAEMERKNRRSNKNMAKGSGSMAMPLRAPVTSPFGWRKHPIFGVRKFHTGVDLAGPNHSAIRASDSGNVLYTGWYGGYGKVVIISHGNGMATLYAHLSRTAVEAGQNVAKGDTVGYEGTTGFSTGPHLHFEVRLNGKPNNPLEFLH